MIYDWLLQVLMFHGKNLSRCQIVPLWCHQMASVDGEVVEFLEDRAC
jgi:hypothetical protein